MEKVYLIFDYFKEAFHINRNNKSIYRPQLAYIGIKLLTIIVMGLWIYSWVDKIDVHSFTENDALYFVLSYGLTLLLIALIYGIISVIVESGLYNMYKKALISEKVKKGDFSEGVRKYFFKFFLGKLLIFVAWIVILPVYLITGVITISLGFALVPLLIDIFLTMWKVSLVMNDSGIIEAIKDSFKFAKLNFLPLTVLQLIHWAFVKGAAARGGGGGFGGNVGNMTNYKTNSNSAPFDFPGLPHINTDDVINVVMKIVKIAIGVIIPVITIAALAASLVKMIFEVFFSLVLFVAYNRKFIQIEENPLKEVLS
jgi:hypothetical protein